MPRISPPSYGDAYFLTLLTVACLLLFTAPAVQDHGRDFVGDAADGFQPPFPALLSEAHLPVTRRDAFPRRVDLLPRETA